LPRALLSKVVTINSGLRKILTQSTSTGISPENF